MPEDVNFNELLTMQVESAERPKNFPVGSYSAVIAGHEFGKSSQKNTPYVRFHTKLLGPGSDVDPDLFDEAGGMEALAERKALRQDFYFTKDAVYRLREFLEEALLLNCAGRTFDEVIPEATNASLLVTIRHQAGTREGEFFMFIHDCAPVDEE